MEEKKLLKLDRLLKKKIELLGFTERDKNEKKNIKTVRDFIDKIVYGRIDQYIEKLEEQTKGDE